MILGLFETAEQKRNDDRDLKALFRKYGLEILDVLEKRVNDESLSERDRKHWARLLRKANARY